MGLFDFIFKKEEKVVEDNSMQDIEDRIDELNKYSQEFDVMDVSTIASDDYLGLAANAGHTAKKVLKDKDYEEAWKLYNQQKMYYMQHAERQNWNARDTIRLDSSVHENLANILRLEGKHKDALVNLIYCIACNEGPTKSILKKLPAYLKRAKLQNFNIDDLELFIKQLGLNASMRDVQNKIKQHSD